MMVKRIKSVCMVLVSKQMLSKVQERCQEETLELVNRTTTEEEAR